MITFIGTLQIMIGILILIFSLMFRAVTENVIQAQDSVLRSGVS